MRRAVAVAAGAGLIVLAAPAAPAVAHGLSGRRDLPIPEWLFVWGAALVLLISFVALASLWPKPRLEDDGWRALGGSGRFLASKPVEIVCGVIGVTLFVLTVYSGLAGEPSVGGNLAPTFIYVVFWVALVPVSVLFGDVFRAFNPWRAVARFVSWIASKATRGSAEPFEYPERLGHWPAVIGLLGFATMELVLDNGADPRTLAIAALVYSALTWFAMALYGVERWTERGEAFSVYFGLFARLSVFERRGDTVGRRKFLSGLSNIEPLPGTVPFLAVMIGSTSFDGVSEGELFQRMLPDIRDFWESIGFGTTTAAELGLAVGLLASILIVLGFYWLGVLGARTVGEFSAKRLATGFVHSLVPIALAYVLAHYVSLILFQMQTVPALLSDPLAKGSDIFGWADVTPDLTWVGAETLWYLQVGFVVLGHVAALALAHDRALALYPKTALAVRSQYWMLGVMVGFTCLALWLLSEASG